MAESKQQQKDRERLAQLRADTSEVWNSPRVVKVSEPATVPVGPEGSAVVRASASRVKLAGGLHCIALGSSALRARMKGIIFCFHPNSMQFLPLRQKQLRRLCWRYYARP